MIVKLSSKGQLVIPSEIRQQLMLQTGATLEIRLIDRDIVIRPLSDKIALAQTVDRLYGSFADVDLINALETEHRQELARDERREQQLYI